MSPKKDKRNTYIALASVAGVLTVAAVVVAVLFAAGVLQLPAPPVPVPNVTGLDAPVARSRLAQIGLVMRTGDERFSSSVAPGGVVDQQPTPGTMVEPGTVIVVAVSAGSEQFPLPDVTGLPLETSVKTLQSKGLTVRVERIESRLASGTVVGTVPSPGVNVSTADTVTLRVSGGSQVSSLLLPFKMKGMRVVIDPDPAAGTPDVSDDVTRRLRSLLEASGAQVTVTRSVVNTSPPWAQRQLIAMEASPTVIIGLSAAATGPGGLHVAPTPSAGKTAPYFLKSVEIGDKVAASLTAAGLKSTTDPPATDPVLTNVPAPGIRLHLGAYDNQSDQREFGDPNWTDLVARALYEAVGDTFAPRAQEAPSATVPSSTPATSSQSATSP